MKTKTNKKYLNKKNGFAMLYVLVFMIIAVMAVVTISLAMVFTIKLNRQSQASLQSYNLALTAVQHGYNKFTANGSNASIPSNACPTANYNRVEPALIASINTPTPVDLTTPAPDITKPIYDFRVCYVAGGNSYIEGIGYYYGYKINLKADIISGQLKIYQTGPS